MSEFIMLYRRSPGGFHGYLTYTFEAQDFAQAHDKAKDMLHTFPYRDKFEYQLIQVQEFGQFHSIDTSQKE